MTTPRLDDEEVRRVVEAALREDLGDRGDITGDAVVPPEREGAGTFVARSNLVVAGLPVAQEVFRRLDPRLEFRTCVEEGSSVTARNPVARVRGAARPILAGERTALNFLMRMSGIATAARAAVEEIAGTGATILDTRKTAPGLRAIDKYAVAVGGARNHRMGLHDAILIKDTHARVAGGVRAAVARAIARGHPPASITVEVGSAEELEDALAAGAGRALLDNMDVGQIRACVEKAAGRIELEVSGGLRPGHLRAVAATGVSYLSLGYLTHSAPAADLAMDMEALP